MQLNKNIPIMNIQNDHSFHCAPIQRSDFSTDHPYNIIQLFGTHFRINAHTYITLLF